MIDKSKKVSVPSDKLSVKVMRWFARVISILWALGAFFWILFYFGSIQQEGEISLAVFIIVTVIAFVMILGSAIIASGWRKLELLGGIGLLVDGALIAIGLYLLPHMIRGSSVSEQVIYLSIMVLPALAAGILFLICQWKSKTSR
jgi:hypothetical protein